MSEDGNYKDTIPNDLVIPIEEIFKGDVGMKSEEPIVETCTFIWRFNGKSFKSEFSF